MPSREALLEEVRSLPDRPGVYVFRDEEGDVLYVGKAKSLRSRVRSYFGRDRNQSLKLRELKRRIRDFETFVLDSEAEALLLEANLIKEHSPPFNIQLRDDKSYPYIKVTVDEPFPRVFVTRRLERDGSRYFGPFTDVGAMRRALRAVKRIFSIRTCHWNLPEEAPDRPCLDYHIDRCEAPCVGYQSREEYRETIGRVLKVLGGRTSEVREQLEERMEEAVEELEFERAATLRDTLRGLEAFERRRTPVDFRGGDRDVVGIARSGPRVCGVVLKVREGRLLGRQVYHLRNAGSESDADVTGALIKGFYLKHEDLPPELVVPADFEDRDLVEEYLSVKRDGVFRVHVPQRGRKRRLVELARENAAHLVEQEALRDSGAGEDGEDRGEGETSSRRTGVGAARPGAAARSRRAAASLQDALGLPEPPRSLVCFDVSTLGGRESVGSAVWQEDGEPAKDEYRRFRIESVPDGATDDYAMMQEIVGRYFDRRVREGSALPDLVVIDGGKGQLGAARQAMESAGASDVPAVGLAKQEEEVFVPGRSDPVRFERTDPGLHLLQRVRDEAHRFAVTYSRTLRKRRTLRSELSEVPGVGPSREQELLRTFGSLDRVRKADVGELEDVEGIGPATARKIRERLGGESGRGVSAGGEAGA